MAYLKLSPPIRFLLLLLMGVMTISQTKAQSCKAKFSWTVIDKEVQFLDSSYSKIGSWYWDFGDGDTSHRKSPKHIYNTYDLFDVTLIVADSGKNCADTLTYTVDVPHPCEARFRYIRTGVRKHQFSPIYFSSGRMYTWDFGDTIIQRSGVVRNYEKAGTYKVCLNTYDKSNNCRDTFCENTIIDSKCLAAFDGYTDNSTDYALQLVNGSQGMSSFSSKWSYGDGTTSEEDSILHSHYYPRRDSVSITLIIEDTLNMCKDSLTKQILVKGNCKADFTYKMVDTSNTAYQFTSTSVGKNLRYSWDFGDSTINGNAQNPVHNFNQFGWKYIQLIVEDTVRGCKAQMRKRINIRKGCKARIETIALNNDSTQYLIELKGIDTNEIRSLTWYNFKTKDHRTQAKFIDTFHTNGRHIMSAVVIMNNSCKDEISTTVDVGQHKGCYAEFDWFKDDSWKEQYDQFGQEVHFVNKSIGNNFFWDFGDGVTSTDTHAIHNYANTGVFNACLIAKSLGCADTICHWVRAEKWCGRNLRILVGDFQNEQTIEVIDPVKEVDYLIDMGDGAKYQTTKTKHIYKKPDNYNLCLYASIDSTPLACADTLCWSNSIHARPHADFNHQVKNGTNEVQFTDASRSFGQLKYEWSFGDGGSSNKKDPVHNYSINGTYRAELIISDTVYNTADTVTYQVIIEGDCSVAGLDLNPVNNSLDAKLIAKSPVNVQSFKWFFANGDSAIGNNISHTFPSRGKEVVELHISNSTGSCIKTYKDQIAITGFCTVDFTYYRDTSERDFFFTNTSTDTHLLDFAVWDFYVNNGFQGIRYDGNEKIYHIFQYNRNYLVGLAYQNTYGCIDTVIKKVNAKTCQAKFEFVKNAKNFKIKVVNQSTGKKLNYLWDFGDGNTSQKRLPKHTYTSFGTYNLSLVVKNSGCVDSTNQSFSIDSTGDFSFKNGAFSLEVVEDSLVATNLDKNQIAHPLQAYPMPFADYLIVPTTGKAEIDLIDIQGRSRQIRIIEIEEGYQLQTQHLSKGMYLVQIRYPDGRILHVKALKE